MTRPSPTRNDIHPLLRQRSGPRAFSPLVTETTD